MVSFDFVCFSAKTNKKMNEYKTQYKITSHLNNIVATDDRKKRDELRNELYDLTNHFWYRKFKEIRNVLLGKDSAETKCNKIQQTIDTPKEGTKMIKNNKFNSGLFGKQLQIYEKLKEMIDDIKPKVREVANRDCHYYYANFLFYPYKRVGFQLHRHNSNIALVIPGSDRKFPSSIGNIDVQCLGGYYRSNKSWLNASKNCWPPKPAKGFIILLEQLQKSDLRDQINKLLLFAKGNSDQW